MTLIIVIQSILIIILFGVVVWQRHLLRTKRKQSDALSPEEFYAQQTPRRFKYPIGKKVRP